MKQKKHPILRRIAVILALLLVAGAGNVGYHTYRDLTAKPKTDLKFVFVHGLSGWGSYDPIDRFFPYWGLSGGSVIRYLNQEGYDSYAASVAPSGAPGKAYTSGEVPESGIWYEMPTTVGDHMYFQGGMTKRVKIRPFYLDMVQMISALENT